MVRYNIHSLLLLFEDLCEEVLKLLGILSCLAKLCVSPIMYSQTSYHCLAPFANMSSTKLHKNGRWKDLRATVECGGQLQHFHIHVTDEDAMMNYY